MTIDAFRAEDIRQAENLVMQHTPPGSLMAQAAHGLGHAVLQELRRRRPKSEKSSALAVGIGSRVVRARVAGRRAVLLVGAGNNGGDVLFAGALLAGRGVQVTALALTADIHDAGRSAFIRAGGVMRAAGDFDRAQLTEIFTSADVVIDGIVGLGAVGALRAPATEIVTVLNEVRGAQDELLVVAADIPSGIAVDDGTVPGVAVNADLTVTFGAWKPGLALPPAVNYAGRVEAIDLGLRPALKDLKATPAVRRITDADAARLWPIPKLDDHKYSRGVLGVVAGSVAYPGAAVLTVAGAFEAGVGMLRYVGPMRSRDLVLAHRPEVVAGGGKCQAWVLGPGVAPDDSDQTMSITRIIDSCADDGTPCVVDAGGLEFVPGHVEENIVLTPHAGELVRLLEERGEKVEIETVREDPGHWALQAAELTGATVLLKGNTTLVARPGGTVITQVSAPSWLATAGAGDVLSGILGALLASSADAIAKDSDVMAELAATASLVHGRAAALASQGGPITALAVANAVPAAVREILAKPGTLSS